MLEKYCDILVIGTELPGLVTAAFLARRGLSVQVVENDFFTGHPHIPDPACLTGVNSKLLRSILGRLNVPELTIQHFLKRQSTLQVIFPRHRIDVCGNPLDYADELEREFPEHQNAVKGFYDGLARVRHSVDVNDLYQLLIPFTWGEGRVFKKYIKEYGLDEKCGIYTRLAKLDPAIGAYLEAQYILGYRVRCAEPFSYHVAALFNQGDGEIFGVMSGERELSRILTDRLVNHDGHIRQRVLPQKLLVRNGVVEGVELRGSPDPVLAKYVVWNAPLARLADLLPRGWRYRGLRNACAGVRTEWQWFTARYQLPGDLIPAPMKKDVVLIRNPEADLSGTNFLYLQISDPDASGEVTLAVNFLLSRSALEDEESLFAPIFDEIRSWLTEVLPFAGSRLKLVFPLPAEHRDADTLFPLHENDFEVFRHGASLHGVAVQDETSFASLFPVHYRTRIPNLFITHPHVFYAFGLEAKLMLGLKITDTVWQESEREKKRAMKVERRIA